MKNITIGTAGHVDHGKTSLIKALTGIDTDRLKEEKKRGITIENGFANLKNDKDLRIGIIDVPGHEKFVKNMLAGIAGIDLALLIIAMDEGIKPQTIEHFEILKMLNIKNGIIVFTKADENDLIPFDLLNNEVDILVKNSFLENAERIKVSSYTGLNIDLLKNRIIDISINITNRKIDKELTRLPIDRVFTMEGFGTVVTGTLVEGTIKTDDNLIIYPKCIDAKVRSLQSHTENLVEVFAGQRVAINLSNVKKDMIDRGDVICYKDSIVLTKCIDVKIKLFDTTDKKIKNGDRVHINFGSKQTECKIILLDKEVIKNKEYAYSQLKFEKEIAIKKNDLFIIRFLSPVVSIGGGVVIDCLPKKHKRKNELVINYLKIMESNDLYMQIKTFIKNYATDFFKKDDIVKRLHITNSEFDENIDLLISKNDVLKIGDNYTVNEIIDDIKNKILNILDNFYEKDKISFGINREELKNKILNIYNFDEKICELIFAYLIDKKVIEFKNGMIKKYGVNSGIFDENEKIANEILKIYKNFYVEVLDVDQVVSKFLDKKNARIIINDLTKNKKLIKLDEKIYMNIEIFNEVLDKIYDYIDKNKKITLADVRDMLKTSRKYALYILDMCDKLKITRREEDYRVLLKKIHI